jgi:hypothetical protein
LNVPYRRRQESRIILLGAQAMLRVAFAGTFPASLEQPVRRHLTTPREIIVASEANIFARLPEIDVLASRPFHELPNVLMTPHVSGWIDGMLDARARLIAENIRRVAAGEPPLNQVL